MDYIIRIYRYQKDKPQKLIGIVEEVGFEGKRAFNNFDELWKILNPSVDWDASNGLWKKETQQQYLDANVKKAALEGIDNFFSKDIPAPDQWGKKTQFKKSGSPSAERRLTVRKPFKKSIGIEKSSTELSLPKNIQESGTSFDISEGGLGLTSGFNLRRGEQLRLSIPLQGKDITIPVLAEVVWTQRTDNYFRTGLRFLS